MTIKDHATGLTYLCALPRKRPHLVAYKLREIFGIIGYPKIFHTDNGKEFFTTKVVLKAPPEMNPHSMLLPAAPVTHLIKVLLRHEQVDEENSWHPLLTERKLSGDNPNWTEVLGWLWLLLPSIFSAWLWKRWCIIF
jgi:hypothetical protein